MSNYHESIKNVLCEVNKFLSITLKTETLSCQAETERNNVCDLIKKLYTDYDNLRPESGDEGSTSSAFDESRNTVGSNQGSDDGYSENIIKKSVRDLTAEATKLGFLEHKVKTLKFIPKFESFYCVYHKNILYLYKKDTDKTQKLAYNLTGYSFEATNQHVKDTSRKSGGFELSCLGKKTYQFISETKEDADSWKAAIEEENFAPSESVFEPDDIYEPVTDSRATEVEPELTYIDAESLPVKATVNSEISNSDEDDGDVYEPIAAQVVVKASLKSDNQSDISTTSQSIITRSLPAVPDTVTTSQSIATRVLPPVPVEDDTGPPLPSRNDVPRSSISSASEAIPPLPERNPPKVKSPMPDIPIKKTCPKMSDLLNPPAEDFENMFFSLWANKTLSEDELSFEEGEIIHVISKDLENQNWWIGELTGKIGLVPKSYLSPAYIEVS